MRKTRDELAAEKNAARDAAVLEAALILARSWGYQFITREAVAKQAGVSLGSVNNAFGKMILLKREVLRIAVERGILEIVAQGLADGHEIARNAPPAIKQGAAALIV